MKIGIFGKDDDINGAGIGKIRRILKKYGLDPVHYNSLKKADCDILLVVGDDSTVLNGFIELDREVPVLGISVDGPHFLTEVEIDDFEYYLKKILKKDYWIEKRTRLKAMVDGKDLPPALNEISLFTSKAGGFLRYSLRIDDQMIWRDSGDGVILTTPTGSTGYGLSAGGPIIMEDSGSIGIVPICSANMNKPIIVRESAKINLCEIYSASDPEIVIDGRYSCRLKNEKIDVEKSGTSAQFIRFDKRVYLGLFGKIREKKERLVLPKDAPPSAKFIYKLLEYEGTMTQKEIVSESNLPSRTARHALEYLLNIGLVERHLTLRDTRQSVYMVKK